MHRFFPATCGAMLLLGLAGNPAHAQTPASSPNAAPSALKIVVTASRYDGDRRISSLPYTLSVTAVPGIGRLRMGTQVPVPSTTAGKDGGPPITSYNYRDVGTNIDLRVLKTDDDRFRVDVSFEDSSVFTDDRAQRAAQMGIQSGAPTIRSFSLTNSVVLKDGQSAQFNTTPDKVSGEVLKLDISLSVIK